MFPRAICVLVISEFNDYDVSLYHVYTYPYSSLIASSKPVRADGLSQVLTLLGLFF